MPKFWFPLAVQAPDWMGPAETREPGLPKETAWRPYITFLITFIDVKNAMNVIPGQFVANGHDYRASLARFTSLAYDLPADDDTIATLNRVLAERELQWAERRVIDQQYADAQAQVTEQLAKWASTVNRRRFVATRPKRITAGAQSATRSRVSSESTSLALGQSGQRTPKWTQRPKFSSMSRRPNPAAPRVRGGRPVRTSRRRTLCGQSSRTSTSPTASTTTRPSSQSATATCARAAARRRLAADQWRTTFVHGVFDPVPLFVTEPANLPDWTALSVAIDDEPFDLEHRRDPGVPARAGPARRCPAPPGGVALAVRSDVHAGVHQVRLACRRASRGPPGAGCPRPRRAGPDQFDRGLLRAEQGRGDELGAAHRTRGQPPRRRRHRRPPRTHHGWCL